MQIISCKILNQFWTLLLTQVLFLKCIHRLQTEYQNSFKICHETMKHTLFRVSPDSNSQHCTGLFLLLSQHVLDFSYIVHTQYNNIGFQSICSTDCCTRRISYGGLISTFPTFSYFSYIFQIILGIQCDFNALRPAALRLRHNTAGRRHKYLPAEETRGEA